MSLPRPALDSMREACKQLRIKFLITRLSRGITKKSVSDGRNGRNYTDSQN